MITQYLCVLDETIKLDKLMKQGSDFIFRFSFLLLLVVFIAPTTVLVAQEESSEEIFWGDDEDEEIPAELYSISENRFVERVWTVSNGNDISYGRLIPVIYEGQVFYINSSGYISSVDFDSGNLLW